MTTYPQTPQEVAAYVFTKYYVDRDIEKVLNCFCEDVTWIGPCEQEYLIGREAVARYFQAGFQRVPPCKLSFEDLQSVQQNEHTAVVIGRFLVNTDMKDELLLEVKQRCSLFMENIHGHWMVRHLHNSNIYEDMHEDEFFPKSVGHQTMEYLNRKLKEKSDVIEMINDNINGGLKGSNDDETYSFYYVNEGLCKMLGYTYDEFMEMSHGSAVGAVYPPDLKAALKACEECFAKGTTYCAQYRIRKKDGSLLWVLDSGKKCIGDDGKVRINSILMDITDLKNSQSELRLERERYRIAINNITDVMFEYDIQKDVLIKYERKQDEDKSAVNKTEVEHYKNYLKNESDIHIDDVDKLLSYICGKHTTAPIEIRKHTAIGWKWIRVTCSYLFDEEQTPLRCIGIWCDITKEKQRLDTLIDLSKRDALTHLYNAKHAELMIMERMETHEHGAMIILDVDDFKHVNDGYGHLKGNYLLMEAASIMKRFTGPEDIVARIGGDEFLIYMGDCEEEAVLKCAKHILMDTHRIHLDNAEILTFSIGIAYREPDDDYMRLFQRADLAMYKAKESGRNQIYISIPQQERLDSV